MSTHYQAFHAWLPSFRPSGTDRMVYGIPCNPADANMRDNIRRKPWSVPRLRGRGEQGNTVMHT
jgi:hypothetical protein